LSRVHQPGFVVVSGTENLNLLDFNTTTMTEKETEVCPNCDNDFLTYLGFVRFEDDKIVSIVTDWRCPKCEETGKLDVGGRKTSG